MKREYRKDEAKLNKKYKRYIKGIKLTKAEIKDIKTSLNLKKLTRMVHLIQHKNPKLNYKLKKGFFNLKESNNITRLKKKLDTVSK